MLSNIQIRIAGLEHTLRRIDKLRFAVTDVRQDLTDFAVKYINEEISKNWWSKGRYFKKQWPALRPITIRRKGKGRVFGYSTEMLMRSEKMRWNFKYQIRTKKLAAEPSVGYKSLALLTIYNPTKYFKFHQLGAPNANLPQRIMLRITKDQERMTRTRLKKSISQKVNVANK